MKITIVGTGYVGLVTGTCFAEVGHRVVCVDCDAGKIKMLQAGGVPIYEPGLEELVKRNVAEGRLTFTTSTKEGVDKSDIIFIAVPTPPLPDGAVDLSFIEGVARDIAGVMTDYKIVVDKSTVPVKTGEKVAETIKRYCKAKVEFDVVSNPEFLREGFAVEDFMRPDRVVIGVSSQRPVQAIKEVFAPCHAPIIITDINSAELIKHAANSFLALKISYVNAISVICEATGANVQEVANGIGMDARIGRRFLDAGLGFVLGLAFKQNTDDVRMSPAIELCHRLQKDGALLRVHDPKAMEKAKAVLSDATFVADMNAVADGCDALVVATEWPEFKKLDLERARKAMTHPILFDGRNLFDPKEMEQLGFIYKSIGR